MITIPIDYTFNKGALDHLYVTCTLDLLSALILKKFQSEHTVTIEWLILYVMIALFKCQNDFSAREGLADTLTYTALPPLLEWGFSRKTSAVPRW